jgi:pimeloyl-ACP methyl ester carboxylesterase
MGSLVNYKNTIIHYTDRGKGTAVVLLHGFLENCSMWEETADLLCKRNRVICVDLLGHGKTENSGYVHSMDEMAAGVAAVLNSLRIRKAIFVGHSMGGYVALAFAEKHPDHVKGLCLMNSTSRADTEEKKASRSKAIQLVKKNHLSFIRTSIPLLFRSKNRKLFRSEINEVKHQALQTSKQGVIAALEGMKIRQDREVLLHFGPYPKMLIFGKKDPILNFEDLTDQARGTQTTVKVFSGGHMSHLENKSDCIEAIKNFVKKC